MTSGDVLVISFGDLITFSDEELLSDDDEPLERAIDLLDDWQRRKVRAIITELANLPEEQLAAMIRTMSQIQAGFRRERRTAPTS